MNTDTLNLNTAKKEDTFEIISFKYKDEINYEEQLCDMKVLNDFISNFEGFISRDYFFSKSNGRWIDVVVWSSLEKAVKASDAAMENEMTKSIFAKMDEKSMVFSHYNFVDGI